MKNHSKRIITVFLMLLSFFMFTSCSFSFSKESDGTEEEPSITRLATYTDTSVKDAVKGLTQEVDILKTKVESATDQDAGKVKSEINQLKVNVESFDKELETAVKDSKISAETKQSYDEAIETMKTNIDELNTKLEEM